MDNTTREKPKIILKEFWENLPLGDKIKLKKVFERCGLCHASVYRRFKNLGFHPWEYEGIEAVLKEYGLTIPKDKRKLWESIPHKEDFYRYMYEKGMSRPTVNYRFKYYNFKRFELMGVKKIVADFQQNPNIMYKRAYRKKKFSFSNIKSKKASF